MSKNILDLIDVLTKIGDKKVMKNFLIDITTPAELNTLQERLNVAFLLNNDLSYKEISKQTGSSTTTITRVARFLKDEKFGGYRWVIKNLFKKTDKKENKNDEKTTKNKEINKTKIKNTKKKDNKKGRKQRYKQ